MKKRASLFLSIVLLFVSVVALSNAQTKVSIWSDNFDAYPVGANLHGIGGWKGWANDPTFTAFTTNAQARSSPNSVDIIGSADLIHEYTVNSGLVRFRFYQYIPGNFQGTSYLIMLNQYDDTLQSFNVSTQVSHNSAIGLMVDNGVSGATMPYITDQWVEVCVQIDLDQDTQQYYYNRTLFYSGTWSNHVSGGGVVAIGAVDLFANAATSVFYDDMSLEAGDCLEPNTQSFLYLPFMSRK